MHHRTANFIGMISRQDWKFSCSPLVKPVGLACRNPTATQQIPCSAAQLAISDVLRAPASYEDGIPSRGYRVLSHRLPQPALEPVADNSITDPLAHYKSEAAMIEPVGQIPDDQQPISSARALPVNLGMPFGSRDALASLHHRALRGAGHHTLSLWRPLNRRRLNTARPSDVADRERKPWTRARRRFFG